MLTRLGSKLCFHLIFYISSIKRLLMTCQSGCDIFFLAIFICQKIFCKIIQILINYFVAAAKNYFYFTLTSMIKVSILKEMKNI